MMVPFPSFPKSDKDWAEDHWSNLIKWFLDAKIVSAKELASLMLGHLNPSQVGTSIASNPSFQRHFPPRQIMRAVITWHFNQTGKCADCGTRLELQADHVKTKEEFGEEANKLENLTLRSYFPHIPTTISRQG